MGGEDGRKDFKERVGERHAAHRAVAVRIPGRGPTSMTLSNVSPFGVCLKTGEFLRIGGTVHLCLDGDTEMPLHVRWQLGGRAGAKFEPEASPGVLDATLLRLGLRRNDAS